MYSCFAKGIVPLRFLPEVSAAYFEPQLPALEERTAWSLHNAFTGIAKAMPMTTRLPAIQKLGRMFGMSSSSIQAPGDRLLAA